MHTMAARIHPASVNAGPSPCSRPGAPEAASPEPEVRSHAHEATCRSARTILPCSGEVIEDVELALRRRPCVEKCVDTRELSVQRPGEHFLENISTPARARNVRFTPQQLLSL